MLLALSINKLESVQAFIFYIVQYSITNVNAFLILLAIGYFILIYYNDNKEYKDLKEKNNSPIQLITQLKGFYKINGMLSVSLTIALLSFLGVPPLIGFFGKQMVLSAAINNGYIFITLIAVLTSVISAVYYLIVIKHIFFDENSYVDLKQKVYINKLNNVKLGGHLTLSISILTLITILYMFAGKV
jgi:NADH-ubiquinone oxidoreductase chain 2